MSNDTPSASGPGLLVTAEQRDRAEGLLAEAYAEGRVTEAEFDQRLDQVLSARTRLDLNTAFTGLIAPAPARVGLLERVSRVITAIAGLGTVPRWVLGPLATYFMSGTSGKVRSGPSGTTGSGPQL